MKTASAAGGDDPLRDCKGLVEWAAWTLGTMLAGVICPLVGPLIVGTAAAVRAISDGSKRRD